MIKLNNRVIVITGASSGIGAALAQRCAAEGMRLVLAARSTDKLESLAQQIVQAGGQALAVPTDITCAEQVQHLAASAIATFGQIDVLVNNAGIGLLDPVPQARFADLDEMMQINVYGMVRCTQAVLPHMLARRQGHILNIASLAGLLPVHNFGFYTATKFAVVGMTRVLQLELKGSGVHCTLVCPGVVRTPFMVRADERKYGRTTRLLPWMQADTVARAILHAIALNRSREVIIPAIARPLMRMANAFPSLARLLIGVLG